MLIVAAKAGVRFVVTGEQRAHAVDDGCLADVIGADQDVEARLKADRGLPQLPEIFDVQFREVHRHLSFCASADMPTCPGCFLNRFLCRTFPNVEECHENSPELFRALGVFSIF